MPDKAAELETVKQAIEVQVNCKRDCPASSSATQASEVVRSPVKELISSLAPRRRPVRVSHSALNCARATEYASRLPPVSRFAAAVGHGEKIQKVIAKLGAFFERFFGLSALR